MKVFHVHSLQYIIIHDFIIKEFWKCHYILKGWFNCLIVEINFRAMKFHFNLFIKNYKNWQSMHKSLVQDVRLLRFIKHVRWFVSSCSIKTYREEILEEVLEEVFLNIDSTMKTITNCTSYILCVLSGAIGGSINFALINLCRRFFVLLTQMKWNFIAKDKITNCQPQVALESVCQRDSMK